MTRRRLKRDALWEAILQSGIFTDPALFHDGTYWCVTFKDPSSAIGYRFITIGRNLKRAHAWLARNANARYPQPKEE